MRPPRSLFSIVMVVAMLSGCIQLLPEGEPPPQIYTLTTPDLGSINTQDLPSLSVSSPTTIGALRNDRLAVMKGAQSLSYYRGVRWAEPLPALVRNTLVESLENANLTRQLATTQDGVRQDYELHLMIRQFALTVGSRRDPVAEVRITARLVHVRRRETVAAERFTARSEARRDSADAAMAACDEAASAVLKDVALWTVTAMRQAGEAA
jgi:cholesterol transport system auxiliary component